MSQGQAAIDRAAAANKYLFLFFYREKNPATDAAWAAFQPAVSRLADSADWAPIAITDPAEKAIVARYDLSRTPMPLVLAVAPNGAITKAFPGKFDPRQIQSAFVSPCTQQCLKALQDRKLVLLCVQEPRQTPGQPAEVTVPKGVADFKADPRYGQATEIVLLNPRDETEAALLKDFQINPQTTTAVTVFLAPPGAMIGLFAPTATKDQMVAKLTASQSNPCAGGKCGPNGCGPKK